MHFKMLLLVGCVLLMSCEHSDPVTSGMPDPNPDPNLEATLTNIQETIFDVNCALSGCHAGASSQQGMNLSAGQAFDNIVNVPSRERSNLMRVDPGSPDDSYLVHKIQGNSDIVGARMPLGRTALSGEQINLIRTWISNGAPNN